MCKTENGFLFKGHSVMVALVRLPTNDKSPIFTRTIIENNALQWPAYYVDTVEQFAYIC